MATIVISWIDRTRIPRRSATIQSNDQTDGMNFLLSSAARDGRLRIHDWVWQAWAVRLVFYYPRAMTGDGGPTVTLWAWAGELAARGHRVRFLHAGGSATSPLHRPGVRDDPVQHVGSGRTLRPRGLGEHIDGSDILVLNSGYVGYNLIAAREARRVRIPYIVIPQGAYDPQIRTRRSVLKRLWEIAEVPMIEKALGIHLAFESEVAGVTKLAPRAKCIVAPTGATLSDEHWQGGGGYLAWLGRYDIQHKGLDILIRAVARIGRATRPRVVLHGRDHIHRRQEVEDLARRFGVDDAVEVRGPVTGKAKREFLRRADGYVLPSRWECHSTALLENLTLGVPCLVSSGAHIAASLQQARAAIIAEPTDESMARGLVELRNAGLMLGEKGRHFVERELDWDLVVNSFVAQVSSLLERRMPG